MKVSPPSVRKSEVDFYETARMLENQSDDMTDEDWQSLQAHLRALADFYARSIYSVMLNFENSNSNLKRQNRFISNI